MSMLASSWAERGKEVTLLTFDQGETPAYPIQPSVKLFSLSLKTQSGNVLRGLYENLHRIWVLRRAIRESHPDVVISFINCTNVLTLLATRGLGRPVIVSERSDPAMRDIGLAWNFLRFLTYRFADGIVCQTVSALARFRSLTRDRGFVIPNPVEAHLSSSNGLTHNEKKSEKRFLVAMGRLGLEKGFDILLNAFSTIARRHPQWYLTVFGDGPLRGELEVQVKTLKLANQVNFAGEVADSFSALCGADLFVLPSRFEGFPNVLLEAMACGLPVVSFDCPSGPRHIIRHGVDGILVPPEDEVELAVVLDRLMSNSDERNRLASRAPEVLGTFGLDKILLLWEQLFENLLSRKHGQLIAHERL